MEFHLDDLLGGAGALAIWCPPWALAADDTYDQESTLKAATEFFGNTTEGLAKVIEKAFREQGRPNGYIRGEEVAGAVTAVTTLYAALPLALIQARLAQSFGVGRTMAVTAAAGAALMLATTFAPE